MEAPKLSEVYETIATLSLENKLNLIEYVVNLVRDETATHLASDPSEIWTDEELADLLKDRKPLTGREIVEKHLKTGVIGSWADEGITDSAEWVNKQKAERIRKSQW